MPTFREKPNQGLMTLLRMTLVFPVVLLGACESEQASQEEAAPVEITAIEVEAAEGTLTRENLGQSSTTSTSPITSPSRCYNHKHGWL